MSASVRPPLYNGNSVGAGLPSCGVCRGSLKAYLVAWITTCAAYYEAAARYEKLSKLSDAELRRRGLTRADLARRICAELPDDSAFDQTYPNTRVIATRCKKSTFCFWRMR